MANKRLTAKEKREIIANNSNILRRILKYKFETIGIDSGTNTTGFYTKLTGGLEFSGEHLERMHRIEIIVNEFIKTLKKISKEKEIERYIAIFEDYSYNLRGSVVIQIAELTGVLKLVLLKFGIPFVSIAPQTLKKFVLGPSRDSQKSQKQFILLEVLDKWGEKFNDDNVCDAFCLYKFLDSLRNYLMRQTYDGKKIPKWQENMFESFLLTRGLPQMPNTTPSQESPWP